MHLLRTLRFSAALFLLAVFTAAPAFADDPGLRRLLPEKQCSEGWPIEGAIRLFDKKNLFNHINGEAELYFPYGFEALATALYVNRKNPDAALNIDVYKMGSLLDAFGIYSSYRRTDSESIRVGAEGFISPTQLMFYQGRYFVRIQASGTEDLNPELFRACAQGVSGKIPEGLEKPAELKWLDIPGLVPRSERYFSKSLLGYDFFNNGFTAEIRREKETVKLFLSRQDSADSARSVLRKYREHLRSEQPGPKNAFGSDSASLTGNDPLYGGVFIEQWDRFVMGAIRIKNPVSAKSIVSELRKRLPQP